MNTPSNDVQLHEYRTFSTKEDAITFLESLEAPDSIIILTPPPH